MATSTALKNELKGLDGPKKAAVVMMALSEEQAAKLFAMMTDDEIKEITQAMAALGSIQGSTVEALFVEFVEQMAKTGTLVGSFDSTERLLLKVLDQDRVHSIMEEIRGPGRPDDVGQAQQRQRVRPRQLSEKRVPADRRRRALQSAARDRRAHPRRAAGRVRDGSRDAPAAQWRRCKKRSSTISR